MSDPGPATIAKRLGIGLKALRLWEAEGLIRPHRLQNGWRVFRTEDITAAWRITALKGLGFPLKAIKALLMRGTPSLDVILSVQEAALDDQIKQMSRAKLAVAAARARLAKGDALDADTLIQLHQETTMTNQFSNEVTEELWQKAFTPEQLEALGEREFSEVDAQKAGARWAALIAEADKLRVIGDATSPEALDLGRRWFSLVREFTQGDQGLFQSSRAFYQDGYAKPETAAHMPFPPEVWDFIGKVAGALIARGENIT